jgi:methylated-DNA-[protein]-cysteine S-methyltransferase
MPLALTRLHVEETEKGIASIRIVSRRTGTSRCDTALRAYLRGESSTFDVPLDLQGTPFDLRVWKTLLSIPYGQTLSYADLAVRAGFPRRYARAVAQAVGRNPVAIVVPCHRVVGSAPGSLGGYAYGVGIKKQLLALERRSCRNIES